MKGLIIHWDGKDWKDVYTAGPQLNSVWGSGSNAWAVGSSGTVLSLQPDGSWTDIASQAMKMALGNNGLSRIRGSGPSDIWATGANVMIHFDGSEWSIVKDHPPQAGNGTNGIWGTGPSDVWFGSDGGTLLHWDGQAWAVKDSGAGYGLAAIWGASPDKLWAVGDGVILQYQPR